MLNTTYEKILKYFHWIFANYSNQIIIDVKNVVVGQDYYINTLWQKTTYKAVLGDTKLSILTALKNSFEGFNVTATINDDKLVLTKNISDYFYYFKLSDNLEYNKYLSGRLVIQDQNAPQTDKTYMSIKIITGFNDIDTGEVVYDSIFKQRNIQNFTLNIQAYGEDSFNYLNYLKNTLNLQEVVDYIEDMSFYQSQEIVDVAKLINNGIEQRYSLDVFCYIKNDINLSSVVMENAVINFNGE